MTTEELEGKIKKIIEDSIVQYSLQKTLGQDEYRLLVRDDDFYADIAYKFSDKIWLFVEDDDSQDCPTNALKYVYWLDECNIVERVFLIHILGPNYNSHRNLAQYVMDHFQSVHATLHYYQIRTESWDSTVWQNEFKTLIDKLFPGFEIDSMFS